jgi:hypothetical protein
VVERLEGRQLLSHFFSGATAVRPIQTPGGVYTVTMNGPGLVNASQLGRGVIGLKLYGTTSATTVDIALTRQRLHQPLAPLKIGSIKVLSGQVGAIDAGGASLLGTVTPLNGDVRALQFGDLGPNARIDVGGTLGSLSVGAVELGPNGHVKIAGDLSQSLMVAGPMTVDGGQFVIGHDLRGGAAIGGDLTITDHGVVSVGQDVTGAFAVNGNLALSNNGTLSVGRNESALMVNGNLVVSPTGSEVVVGGDLDLLQVNGVFQGQGTRTATDLAVGLNLGNLVVLGASPNQGGLQGANIDVGKNILGLNVLHGIFDSFISAGLSINGGTNGGNVGADGPDAVLNSDIRAVLSIRDITLNGNVRSTFVSGPTTGYPTRIVAGVDRAGHYSSGGLIDNFQITGQLIDSVLAASVAPGGGAGILPPAGYGPAFSGNPTETGTYNAPAGTITGGTVGAPIKFPNYSIVSYFNETRVNPPNTVGDYNLALSPILTNTILPGAINPSFASAPLPAESTGTTQSSSTSTSSSSSSGTTTTTTIPALSDPNSTLPLPNKSTVLGGVVSSTHTGAAADFAGIFASDTKGVFVGPLPS